jgi:hypothetical protein
MFALSVTSDAPAGKVAGVCPVCVMFVFMWPLSWTPNAGKTLSAEERWE